MVTAFPLATYPGGTLSYPLWLRQKDNPKPEHAHPAHSACPGAKDTMTRSEAAKTVIDRTDWIEGDTASRQSSESIPIHRDEATEGLVGISTACSLSQ